MTLREGAVIEVVVSSVRHFGVFVDFEGAEGLILITNLYWDFYDVPRRMVEDFKPGQRLCVKVLVVAPRQFSASLKDMHPDQNPWKDPSIYAIGTAHAGIVSQVFEHGPLLIRLENGAQIIVPSPKPGIGMGDRITVRVTDLDVPRERIMAEQLNCE